MGSPTPWPLWETFALRTPYLQAVPETASCSRRMTLPDSREKVSVSPLTERRNLSPLSQRKTNTSLHASRRTCRALPTERKNHARPAAGPLGPLHTWAPDSTSSKKSSRQVKCSPPAKEQPDNHDTKDHCTSSKHKDRSHSDKSSRHSSDKKSSNTPCKHALSPLPCTCSMECPWKGPHVDEPSCMPGESSYASHRSPSRSMSGLKDHRSFTAPTSSSAPNKLRTQPCHQSSSTDSRLFMTPLDMGLYSSFSLLSP